MERKGKQKCRKQRGDEKWAWWVRGVHGIEATSQLDTPRLFRGQRRGAPYGTSTNLSMLHRGLGCGSCFDVYAPRQHRERGSTATTTLNTWLLVFSAFRRPFLSLVFLAPHFALTRVSQSCWLNQVPPLEGRVVMLTLRRNAGDGVQCGSATRILSQCNG